MPELPEVTTVIGVLKPLVIGKTINKIDIFYPRMIQNDIPYFKENLVNKTFIDITRKGKFILFHLTNNLVLISHLRMEGKYEFTDDNEKNPQFTHVVFHLDSNEKLIYFDTRKFGIMKLTTEEKLFNEPPLSNVGPEPMEIDQSNIFEVYKKLAKNKPIKSLITDQSIMAGIGNIYADEILYECKINPLTPGSSLKNSDYNNIINSAKEILTQAIELGGSTIKSYHPKEGVDGKFQIMLKAYGKEGEICERCGTKFHKIFLNGRGTTFCPNCQIDYSLKKAIGITGPIGSGKSSVLDYFNKLGYKTISCDELVLLIYYQETTKKLLKKYLGTTIFDENGEISHKKLRNLISNDENAHKKLEELIFPLVAEELLNNIRQYGENLVIEVPLLFKAHYEYMFKKIFYLTAEKSVFLERLKERNYSNPEEAIELYFKNNPVKSDLTEVIEIKNNGTLEELHKEIKRNI